MTESLRSPGHMRDLEHRMAEVRLTVPAFVEICLARIAAVDSEVQAWLHVLAADARQTARRLDDERQQGKVRSPWHGIPFAAKDLIDVRGPLTCADSPSRADAAPATADATVVAHLRTAGTNSRRMSHG